MTARPRIRRSAGSEAGDAWHRESLVLEWTKHADARAGATLAWAGVLGGLLYILVEKVKSPAAAVLSRLT